MAEYGYVLCGDKLSQVGSCPGLVARLIEYPQRETVLGIQLFELRVDVRFIDIVSVFEAADQVGSLILHCNPRGSVPGPDSPENMVWPCILIMCR